MLDRTSAPTIAQHTPGPWRAEKGVQNTFFIRAAAEGGTICLVDTEEAKVENRGDETVIRRVALPHGPSNAHLIAAAPDMLAALKNVRALISEAAMTGFNCKDGDWAERLFASQWTTSAAIAKAEGRAQTKENEHAHQADAR